MSGFKFEVNGIDDVINELDELGMKAEETEGQHEVSFAELFPPSFMRKYTDCESIRELFASSGFPAETEEDIANIPDKEFDEHVAKVTRFSSWEDMQESAASEYFARKLGL